MTHSYEVNIPQPVGRCRCPECYESIKRTARRRARRLVDVMLAGGVPAERVRASVLRMVTAALRSDPAGWGDWLAESVLEEFRKALDERLGPEGGDS